MRFLLLPGKRVQRAVSQQRLLYCPLFTQLLIGNGSTYCNTASIYHLPPEFPCFFIGPLFDHEDGRDIFLRNVRFSPNHAALQASRRYFSSKRLFQHNMAQKLIHFCIASRFSRLTVCEPLIQALNVGLHEAGYLT
jgi:hypothetical protein